MNQYLQTILNFIQEDKNLPADKKKAILQSLSHAGEEFEKATFKLSRTEKAKRNTDILLQETILELEQKRKAVEAQERELEIDSSLERVRTVALRMNKRDDMLDVCHIISEQLEMLGAKEIRNVQTAIFYKEKGTYMNYEYYRLHDKALITEVDYRHNEMTAAFAEKMQQDAGEFFTESREGNALKDWVEYQKKTPQFVDSYLAEASSLNYYWFSLGHIALGISTYAPLNEEEINLFKRFRNVFEMAYRRFLDIEKAEAQAREAQIELALERVRARTLAMQKSDELSETVFILFQQFKQLGESPDQATIGIINEKEKVIEYWVTMYGNQTNRVYKFSIDEPNVTNKIYMAWKEQKKSLVIDLSGKELYEFATYRAGMGGAVYNETENRRIINVAFFSKGLINVQSNESRSEESIRLLERFAAVFEQTYTRFLDLQKAEAQARESKIEAALERVRSRTMGMQKSTDLLEVINVLSEQFLQLGFKIHSANFNTSYRQKDWNLWLYNPGTPMYPDQIYIPYLDNPFFNRTLESIANGADFAAFVFTKEEKDGFLDHLYSNTIAKNTSEERKRFAYDASGFAWSTVYLKNTALTIANYDAEPYSEEQNAIIRRFGNVFEQSYTRFLDLQKAEAQAREAQIEASLERVRGKAMSMHSSKDLNDTIVVFYHEVELLSITPRRCGVGLIDKYTHVVELSAMSTTEQGESIETIGKLKLTGHQILEGIYDNWILQKEYYPVLRGNEIKEYYQLIRPQIAYPDYPTDTAQYGYFFFFNEGGVYAWTEKELSEDEIKIYRRFTSVLGLTYKRYKDLKDAEANAREAIKRASLDRLRAETASMRTTKDLEKITPLIWNELTTMNVPFIRCGVFIMDESQKLIHTFLSTPEGKAIAAFHLPYDTPGNISQVLNHWHAKKNYIDHWDETAFTEFANTLVKQGALASSKQYLETLPAGGFHLHFLPFLQGMLYVGNTTQLGNDEIKLIQSITDAFSTAYARYEDFNKLEIAKQQVDKTLKELRSTQQQLIQSEKMASLGELTAGIAHEIQNPLNFVNNFSEVNSELIVEMKEELAKGNINDAKLIANDINDNEQKIIFHGKRADAIVKGMLQHSRKTSGQKEPTDINALADEYLRLAYHGSRAKDKFFNATMKTDYDETIGKINIIPQDIGRVILNLITNAFYAASLPSKGGFKEHQPTIWVSTKKDGDKALIRVKDNGPGIPQKVLDKIFQPFFTTKPTGEGTGLGLSISYDIIKAHGGYINIETTEGEGAEFVIMLPLV